MKDNVKVFLMALVGFVSALVSTMGGSFNLWYVALSTIFFVGAYAVTNFLWPSTSPQGVLTFKDIIKGLLMAIFMAGSSYLADVIIVKDWSPDWIVIGRGALSAIMGYLAKTFGQGQSK